MPTSVTPSSGINDNAIACGSSIELEQHLAINNQEHACECETSLLLWPTIVNTPNTSTPATSAHSVHSDSLVSHDNAPFHRRSLVHVTEAPVLSSDVCKDMIAEAEEAGA